MTGDELLIISPLDQDLSVDDTDILDRIEQLLLESIAEKNVQKALHICKQLYGIAKISGKALANTLYLIKINWDKFDVSDKFEDTLTSATGLHKHTIQTYTQVWGMYEEGKIPEQFEEDIINKNIKLLVPIAQAINQGYELNNDDWKELAEGSDYATINSKLREIKGKEPRSHALILMIDREGGIKAIKAGEQKYVGWLNVDEDDEIVQQAIERIKKGSGLIESR